MKKISFGSRITISLLIKIFSAISLFLLTRVLLKNNSPYDFAIISVLLSFFSWFLVVDLGVGSALRNSIGSLMGKDSLEDIYCDIRNAFHFLTIIAVAVMLLSCFVLQEIDLKYVFNTDKYESEYLFALLIIMIFSSCLSLPFIAFKSWFLAMQKNEMESFQNLLFYLFPLCFFYLFYKCNGKLSLIGLCVALAISYLISNSMYMFVFVKVNKKSIAYGDFLKLSISWKYIKGIMLRSYSFFFIQLAGLVIYSTGTFFVNLFTGSESTTLYVLLLRIVSVPMLVSNVVLSFYWSKMTTLYFSEEKQRANSLTAKMLMLLVIFGVSLIVFYFYAGEILYFIFSYDTNIVQFNSMMITVCIYSFLMVANNIWGTALSAIGKTRFGMFSAFLAAILNIPLGYYFSSVLELGALGVVLGTIVVLIPGIIISPFQYYLFYVSRADKFHKLKVVFS